MAEKMTSCHECGMVTSSATEYHPYLFCELFKLGHTDPAAYLRMALPGAVLMLPQTVGQYPADHYEIVPKAHADAR